MDSTAATIIGASLGGIGTYYVVRAPPGTYDRSRGEYDAIGMGLIAAGMIAGALVGRKLATPAAAAALPATTPPLVPTGVNTGSIQLTLVPGLQTVSQSLPVSTVIILYLPI